MALTVSLIGLLLPVAILRASATEEACASASESTALASPAASGGSDAPSIQIVNPAPSATTLSDKFDGVDQSYHVVASLANVPAGAVAEALVVPAGGVERAIGFLCPPSADAPNQSVDLMWDMPPSMAEGLGLLRVRLYSDSGSDAQQLAVDEIAVDLQHREPPAASSPGQAVTDVAAAEALELTWPQSGGPLGFYKPSGPDQRWSAVIDGTASREATAPAGIKLFYSTTAPGAEPTFTPCGSTGATLPPVGPGETATHRRFRGLCTLQKEDLPAFITAIAATYRSERAKGAAEDPYVQNVSDAHIIQPFVQSPAEMAVALTHHSTSSSAAHPSGRRKVAGLTAADGCMTFKALVVDQYDRPVRGVNVDARITGPTDVAQFDGSTVQAPDGAALTEEASDCKGATNGKQGREFVPDGPDRKIAESVSGTDGDGGWTFKLYSSDPGVTDILAWIDDVELSSEGADRAADDDLLSPSDAQAISWAQWLEKPLELSITPKDDAVNTGTCRVFTVVAKGGSQLAAGLNIDLHARMPGGDLSLCYPDDSVALNEPDTGHKEGHVHRPSAGAGTACDASGPPCVHMEGTTDSEGKLAFGVSSPVTGTGTLRLWSDGETETNDDSSAAGEPGVTSSINFVGYAHQVNVKIVNPTLLSPKISSSLVPVLVRVDAPHLVKKMSVFLATAGDRYRQIGEATRIGMTDTFLYEWDLDIPLEEQSTPEPDASPTPSPTPTRRRPSPSPSESPSPSPSPTPVVTQTVAPTPSPTAPTPPPPPQQGSAPGIPDGTYRVRVLVDGTGQSDFREVQVSRGLNAQKQDAESAFARASLNLAPAGVLAFVEGEAVLSGASTGAEGVDLFYTTSAAKQEPQWNMCGYASIAGSSAGGSDVPFEAICTLPDALSGREVTGVAAAAWNCNVSFAGCADPTGKPIAGTGLSEPGRSSSNGARAGASAVPIFGCGEAPCIQLHPTDAQADVRTCQPFVVAVGDEFGRPVSGSNVDVMISGPGDRTSFCRDVASPSSMRAPAGSGTPENSTQSLLRDSSGPDARFVEGETNAEGHFIVGVISREAGVESIYSARENSYMALKAWVDSDDDDRLSSSETVDAGVLHWLLPGRCTIIGTPDDDVLVGTDEDDKLCALGGNDVVFAQSGRDIMLGGAGDDELYGDDGNDTLIGGSGNDVMYGGRGRDNFKGGGGTNSCPDFRQRQRESMTACKAPSTGQQM